MTTIKLKDLTVPQVAEQETWASRMREAVREAITADDVTAVVKGIVKSAREGNRQAQATLLGMITAAPKSITVNQYVTRRGRKARRGGSPQREVPTLPQCEVPTLEELRKRSAELRRAAGKPVRVPAIA